MVTWLPVPRPAKELSSTGRETSFGTIVVVKEIKIDAHFVNTTKRALFPNRRKQKKLPRVDPTAGKFLVSTANGLSEYMRKYVVPV
jgi:hypothetical protein